MMASRARVGLISPNRPECLYAANAVQLLGGVYTPLHPLAGLADSLHVINDAGVQVLIFDPGRFRERAEALAKAAPGLRLMSLGPSDIGEDLLRLAASFEPAPLVAPVSVRDQHAE